MNTGLRDDMPITDHGVRGIISTTQCWWGVMVCEQIARGPQCQALFAVSQDEKGFVYI